MWAYVDLYGPVWAYVGLPCPLPPRLVIADTMLVVASECTVAATTLGNLPLPVLATLTAVLHPRPRLRTCMQSHAHTPTQGPAGPGMAASQVPGVARSTIYLERILCEVEPLFTCGLQPEATGHV